MSVFIIETTNLYPKLHPLDLDLRPLNLYLLNSNYRPSTSSPTP